MRHIHEPRPVVSEEAVQRAILIGDEEIETAVLVHVEPDRANSLARIVDAHLPGDVDETVAVVVEQHVRRVPERDEQIHLAVVVVVNPADLTGLAHGVDAHGAADLGEVLAAPVIAIQLVRNSRSPAESDIEIQLTVAVEVAPRRGPGIVQVGQIQLGGHLPERAIVMPIEPIREVGLEPDKQVEVAIVVEVGPAIRLTAGAGEQVWLNQLEVRDGQIRTGRTRLPCRCTLSRGSSGMGAASGAHHRGEPGRRQLHEIAPIGSHLLFSVACGFAGGGVFRGSFSGRIAVL